MTPTILYKSNGRFNAATQSNEVEASLAPYSGRQLTPGYMKHCLAVYANVRNMCEANGEAFSWDRFNAASGVADNSAGFQRVIDTLTYISRKVVGQKLYTVAFADFVSVAVGNAAWSQHILTPTSFMIAGDPEEGYNSSGVTGGVSSTSDAVTASITTNVKTWIDSVQYSLVEINQALLANNWDIIAGKHNTRKAKADQLLQRAAFVGALSDPSNVQGLLNATNINVGTTLPGGYANLINTMTAAQIQAFVAALMQDYFSNSNNTELPNTFQIPMADFLGLTISYPGAANPTPLINYLQMAFEMICGPGFKILPVAYANETDSVNVSAGLSKYVYSLYRKDELSLRMEIPVPFQVQAPGTADGLTFTDTAIMQHTGLIVSRPLELRQYAFAV